MGNHPTRGAALTRSGALTHDRAAYGDRATFLFALYLGGLTLVIGSDGITVHRHTRGTLDPDKALFGLGWSRSATAG
jgi:hypothetical protein